MPSTPLMSLKSAPIQFATFTPVEYKMPEEDNTLLAKSLSMQEARDKEARTYRSNLDTYLANARNSLNKDEYDWLAKKANAIQTEIDKQINLGNTESAIRFAQNAGTELARDTDLQNKIKANAAYQENLKKIQAGNYSPITKRRWEDENKYYDDGTGTWTTKNFIPVNDVSIADVWNQAVSRTPVHSDSKSSQTTRNNLTVVDNNGNIVKAPITTTTDANGNTTNTVNQNVLGTISSTNTTKGGSNSVQKKTAEDIMKIFNDTMKDPVVYGAVKQSYDNMIWLYDKATKIINDATSTLEERKQAEIDLATAKNSLADEDGFVNRNSDNFDIWVQRQANQYAKDSAYVHTSTSSIDSQTTGYNDAFFTSINTKRAADAVSNYSPGAEGETQSSNVELQLNPFGSPWKPNSLGSSNAVVNIGNANELTPYF